MAQKLLSDIAVSVFCENMAMMLAAGIGPDEAAELLCRDAASAGELQPAAQSVHDALLAGTTLWQAMGDSGAFPEYVAKMVAAGEQAGRTEQVLRTLAVYYEGRDRLQKKLKSAVVYPTVLLLLMALILIFLVGKLIPVFVGVYQNIAGDLAVSSYGYVRLATAVGWVALALTLVAAAVLLVGSALARTPRGRARLSVLFERLPLTAQASRQLALAGFTQVLAIFIASGVDVDAAADAAAQLVSHRQLSEKLTRARAEMAQGKGLATALYENAIYPPLYGRMLLSGERSGQLEQVLSRLAALLSEDADHRMDALADSIEPALSGFLTVAVGITLLAAMLPLVGILGAIG